MKRFLAVLCFSSLALAGFTGDVLRHDTGARAIGMGGAFTSVADDTSALFYNPAGLAKSGFQLSYLEDDLSSRKNKLGIDNGLKLGSLGYYKRRYIAENFDFVEVNSYGFGVRTVSGIDYGLTYKHINQDTLDRTGDAWCADVGMLLHLAPDLRLGLNFQNLSAANTGTRPSQRVGISKQWGPVLLAYDSVFFDREDTLSGAQPHYGLEWQISDGFALRGGVSNKSPAYGFSIGILGLVFDYAVLEQDRELLYLFGVKMGSEKYPEIREYTVFKQKEYLTLEINSDLIAGQSEYSLFGGTNIGGDYLLSKIRLASEDKDIAGIVLRVKDVPNSLGYAAIMEELRVELTRFKAQGKKVIVYVDSELSANTYYLVSVADHIVMPKMGVIVAMGKSLTVTRYRGLFEKIGLEPMIIKAGQYKDALNPLRPGFTPEQQKHIEGLVNDLNDQQLAQIKADRNLGDKDLADLRDGGIITATQAKEYKLVDELGYFEKVEDYLKEKDERPKFIGPEKLPEYDLDFSILPQFNTIAVVDVDGELVDGESKSNLLFGGKTAGADTICAELKKLEERDEVKAVVVRVNSPGGSPQAADRIYLQLLKLKEKKKYIVISMGNIAASGGYYIAASGDEVFANGMTLTGSIGVIGELLKAKKLYEFLDIKEETIKTGEHMDMDAMGRTLNAAEIQMLEKYQMEIYNEFKLIVATGRKMHIGEVEPLAQGKIYTGQQALSVKLIDKIGTYHDALDAAKRGAHIAGKARVVRIIQIDEDWLMLNSKLGAKLGLDKLGLDKIGLGLTKLNNTKMVELNSYLY